jgi:hypothetical protein
MSIFVDTLERGVYIVLELERERKGEKMRTVYIQITRNDDGEQLDLDSKLKAALIEEKGKIGYFEIDAEFAREVGAKARKLYESKEEALGAGEDEDDFVILPSGRVAVA